MGIRTTTISGLLAASACCGAWAQADTPPLSPVPEAPEVPERVQSGETLEPDIRIIRGEKKVLTEYRVNGKLRAVKVEPKNAPAYYLVDTDGDGNLETRTLRLDPDFLVPQWVLFSW